MTDALKQRIEEISEKHSWGMTLGHTIGKVITFALEEFAAELTADNAALRAQLAEKERELEEVKALADKDDEQACHDYNTLLAKHRNEVDAFAAWQRSAIDKEEILKAELASLKVEYADSLVRPDELVQQCDEIKAQFMAMEEHDVEQQDEIKALRDQLNAALAKNEAVGLRAWVVKYAQALAATA